MGTRTISTRLAIEGEAAYKQAVKGCASELSTLKSSLALTESQFKGQSNSIAALTSKGDALGAMYQKQKEKVAALESALKNAQAAQSKYTDRIAAAKEEIDRCEKSLAELKNSTGDTSEEQAALTAELQKWNSELEQAKRQEEATTKGVNNWQKQLNYANVELNDLSGEIEKNNRYLDEARESADGCAKSIDAYGKEVKQASEQSGQLGKKSTGAINQLAGALAAAGVAASVKEIAEVLFDCAEAAEAFEASVAKVATIADTSAVSMDEMRQRIITLSGETGKSASSIAEATYSAISAGMDTAEAVSFVEKSTRLATAGFTQAETSVDVLTTALNAYGLSVKETEHVSDVLITTQNLGKTTVDELAGSVGKVIPLASAYNVGIENLGASYAVLTANGIATAESGTYMKAMLNELGKNGSTVAKVLKEQTGHSFSGLMAQGYSLGDVLDILGKSVGGDATAFNNLWSSTEAGIGALSIFNKGAKHFNDVLKSMQDSAGATGQAYDTMADTTEFAHQRMNTAFENMQIAIGEQLNPALEKLYDAGASAFDWAAEFIEENPWLVQALTAVAAGMGVLTAGITAVTVIAPLAEKAIDALNNTLSANPVGLVVAGVVALIAALTTLCAFMDSADAKTRQLTESLKESKTAYDELSESMEEEQKSIAATATALEKALKTENKSAAEKAAMLAMVKQLNEALPELGLEYDEVSDSINMTTEQLETMLEQAEKQEEYEAQVARLSELYTEQAKIEERLAEINEEYAEGTLLNTYQANELAKSVRDLTIAQESNAEQIETLQTASAEYADWQRSSAIATADMTSTVNDLTAQVIELEKAYEEAQKKAYDSINAQIGLLAELDGSAKMKVESIINTFAGQIKYMEDYSENLKSAMEMGVDEGLIQKLSDGSEESAQILASIVEGGGDKVAELNDQFRKVEEGKRDFAKTVGDMATEFDEKMAEIEERVGETVKELNISEEAYKAGQLSIQGYIDGAESMRQQLEAKMDSLANAGQNAWKRADDQHSPSKKYGEIGSNDIQGAILGAEAYRKALEKTYAGLAEAAQIAYQTSMPSSIVEPSVAAITAQQTREIIAATRDNKKTSTQQIVFSPVYNSPKALTPAEQARKLRNDMRIMQLKYGGNV